METFEVIGPLPIVDAKTGANRVKGQTVDLDPERTNIRALIEAGHVKPLPVRQQEKAKG